MRYLVPLLLIVSTSQAQEWLTVEPTDRPITVVASGIVASADSLRFGPPPSRSWRIAITDLAREGSLVKKGEVLAQFDGSATDDRVRTLNSELNAKRSELESLLERQAREIEEDKVRLAEAESEEEKATRKAAVNPDVYANLEYRKLLEEKRLASDLYIREQRRGSLVEKVRLAQRAELEADIRRLESEVRGEQQTLDSFTIRAPRDGLVIVGTNRQGQKLDVSDGVNPGIVVVELADPTDLVIQAEVPEYAAASIDVGQTARVSLDASGGSEIKGTVASVASIVRRQSQYSQAMVRDVTVELPDDVIASLRPGMSAKITIVVDIQRAALALPDSVLDYRDGHPGVTVRGDGWRRVTLGRESAGLRVVESGLDAGDKVAVR
jgi:hypothetical protein